MAARNPYVIGVPLTDNAAFYGRQEVFQFIRNVLDAEKQNVIVLYGQRRIGKTSVLYRAAQWLTDGGGFFPVYFDLQGKERLNLGQVLENLAQTLGRRIGFDSFDSALFDDEGRHFKDTVLPRAFERLAGQRLVLLVDEFDVLSDELASPRTASETLFPYLQDLIVTHPQIGFVFVVGRRIEELATHFQAIFKQAVYRRIGHLKPEDSRALITEPARGMVAYTDEAVTQIQNLAAGHPYFTQLICFEAFNAVKDEADATVTKDVVDKVLNRAIESGHGALNWFWEGLPRAERFILSAVAQASDQSGVASKDDVRALLERHRILLSGLELKEAPDRLVEWEMLRHTDADTYQFVVELVRRWVIERHPLSTARVDIDYVNKRAVRLFELAREAHSAGDLTYACDDYRRALKANPNHSGAQLGLALALYELGQLDDAIVEFERAYYIDEMSGRDGLIRARLARAAKLEEQDAVDGAIAEYERVLLLLPTEETAVRRLDAIWQERADAALSAGNLEAAATAFRELLKRGRREETSSRIQAALTAHAEECIVRGEVERATATYEMLLDLVPISEEGKAAAAAFWIRCGDTLDASGQTEDAIAFYSKVVTLFPGDSVAAGRLESARKRQEDRQTVDRIFEQALAAHTAGRMDAARDLWKRLIQMDVLSYAGKNIATLLSETIATPPTRVDDASDEERPTPVPEAEDESVPTDDVTIPEPQPAPASADQEAGEAASEDEEVEADLPPVSVTDMVGVGPDGIVWRTVLAFTLALVAMDMTELVLAAFSESVLTFTQVLWLVLRNTALAACTVVGFRWFRRLAASVTAAAAAYSVVMLAVRWLQANYGFGPGYERLPAPPFYGTDALYIVALLIALAVMVPRVRPTWLALWCGSWLGSVCAVLGVQAMFLASEGRWIGAGPLLLVIVGEAGASLAFAGVFVGLHGRHKGRRDHVAPARAWRVALVVVVAAASVFAAWPASVAGVDVMVYSSPETRAGKEAVLSARVRWSSDWRRGAVGYVADCDFSWSSSNEAVAVISSLGCGYVRGVGPGTARISARYKGVEGWQDIAVVPWDVPAMKANFNSAKFFAGGTVLGPGDRKYEEAFDSSTPAIWVELTLDIDRTAPERAPEAPISYTLYRSDNSVVETYMWIVKAQPEWGAVASPVRLDFPGGRVPDTYHIEFKHAERVIGTGTFVAR